MGRAMLLGLSCALVALLLSGCQRLSAYVPGLNPDAARGLELASRYGCAACHEIPGAAVTGYVGPTLRGVQRRAYLAGGLPNTPGVFFKYVYGGVDFFFLDGRYYRDPADDPDIPGKTMLGAEQKAWLKDELRASRAPFKVLVSGGGFSKAERNGDSWAVYQHERNELFDFIRDNRIEGVFGISGDSHMGELNCVPRSEEGGYDFYDFCSSPLANLPDLDFVDQMPEVRMREVWTRSCNVGVLGFDFEHGPRMTFNLYNVIGASVWDPLVLTPADLRNGMQSWRTKIDPDELVRLERYRRGGSYFDPDAGP